MATSTPQQVLKSAHERRKGRDRRKATFDYPSSFVAQVLKDHARATSLPRKPARNAAIDAYAKGQANAQHRAPAGLSHQDLA